MKYLQGNNHLLTYNISFFLSASHQVVYNGQKGVIHNHLWELEIKAEHPSLDVALLANDIGFKDLEDLIYGYIAQFENKCFNEHISFQEIIPTTENIARLFFGDLNALLSGYGIVLQEISLRESPTRGVKVRALEIEKQDNSRSLLANGEMLALLDRDYEQVLLNNDENMIEKNLAEKFTKEVKSPSIIEQGQEITFLGKLHILDAKFPILMFMSILTIVIVNILLYQNLWLNYAEFAYPWGSDTWGHLFKAEFLLEEIKAFNIYPQYFPYWYNGTELFRHWAPLPYYVLALLLFICQDIFQAHIAFIVLCSVFGSLSFLAFRRYTGLLPALIMAVLWTIAPDHLRVSFAEGNLPRTLAIAFLPYILYLAIQLYHGHASKWKKILFIIFITLNIFTHAMIAAITISGLWLWFALAGWLEKKSLKDLAQFTFLLLLGVSFSAWWLLPALSGGINAIDSQAIRAAIAFFPISESLNPFLRESNMEAFYLGIGYLVLLIWGLLNFRNRLPYQQAALIMASLIFLSSTTAAQSIYQLIPNNHMFWPSRMLSLGILMLFLGAIDFKFQQFKAFELKNKIFLLLWLAIVGLIIWDSSLSFHLVHLREQPHELRELIESANTGEGFKVATLDLSRWGSVPAYYLSKDNERGQVYGWAFQGASTAKKLALINTALEKGWYEYVLEGLEDLGASHFLIPQDFMNENLEQALNKNNYKESFRNEKGFLYTKEQSHYAYVKNYTALGVGRGASYTAIIFPQIKLGESTFIDEYSLEELLEYELLFLSGFDWSNKKIAEERIRAYLKLGGQVVIDMQGVEASLLSGRPSFMGIEAEPISLNAANIIYQQEKAILMQVFDHSEIPWNAYALNGLDEIYTKLFFQGQALDIGGYKQIEEGEIAFIGANLAYHSFLTHDENTKAVLAYYLSGITEESSPRELIEIYDFKSDGLGASFSFSINAEMANKKIIVPIAYLDSFDIELDGNLECFAEDGLLAVRGAEGDYQVQVWANSPKHTSLGFVISIITFFILLAWFMRSKKRAKKILVSTVLMGLVFFLLLSNTEVFAAESIAVDGFFKDWEGQAYLEDPWGDSKNVNTDVKRVYWANNPGEETMYMMIERYTEDGLAYNGKNAPSGTLWARIYFDINNNGVYSEKMDRRAELRHSPSGRVNIDIYDGTGKKIWSDDGFWGDKDANLRAEFYLPFDKLGITVGQGISFYVEASHSASFKDIDRVPDQGDIMHMPIPFLGQKLFYVFIVLMLLLGLIRIMQVKKNARGLEYD